MPIVVLIMMLGGAVSSDAPLDVVRAFYEEIVVRHPLGIPDGDDRAALEPLMSNRLRRLLDESRRCEADYFRVHPPGDDKPEFPWLETGLFSGPNEMALPSTFSIRGVRRIDRGRHEVAIRMTWKETFETYGREPDPRNLITWDGTVIVTCDDAACAIDDFVRLDDRGAPLERLSEAFEGCEGARWKER